MAERYRVNQPSVVHQTIDGETVIIHLERGLYYSLDVTGAEVWEALAAGHSASDTASRLAARFPAQREEVDSAVASLVERLRDEQLIVPVPEGADGGVAATNGHTSHDVAQTNGTFKPPRMDRYDDLQDLLLLDPIHAVDETGWPERPQDA